MAGGRVGEKHMQIQVEELVPAAQAEEAWQLYREAFDELRSTAVQRHVMNRAEFDGVLDDRRILKYLGVDPDSGDRMGALATFTNELDAVPLISPDYFQRRWPTHFAEGRIWYIGFFATHPDYRGSGIFERIIEDMYRVIQPRQGLAALDICRRNEELYGLPQAIHGVLAELAGRDVPAGGVRGQRIDEQSYWLYEFPRAA
jgi:GNAT superfamily N-acetyltransferase